MTLIWALKDNYIINKSGWCWNVDPNSFFLGQFSGVFMEERSGNTGETSCK
jgi:hypothetical protein